MVLLSENLATTLLDPKSIEAFVASRLIALPGVGPIGVGEILRWKCLIAITSGGWGYKERKTFVFSSC